MFEFLRDIYLSFRHSSMEKVKSPVLGAFVFSWLGFNWPMLAILFFSKHDIEERIINIQSQYDISSYIIGPLFTTALISFFLPRANKVFTILRSKPDQQTISLTIAAKKELAEKQQEIAEIDARRSLALTIAEKEIDENISAIKSQNLSLSAERDKLAEENEKLSKWLEDEKELTKKLNSSLSEQHESINIQNNETLSLITALDEKNKELANITNEKNAIELELNKANSELVNLKNTSSTLSNFNKELQDNYKHIFQPDESGQYTLIRDGIHSKLAELDKWAKDML